MNSGVLSFNVKEGKNENNSNNGSIKMFEGSWSAEAGLLQECPDGSKQPYAGHCYNTEGGEHDEEREAEDSRGDGKDFVGKIYDYWDSRRHVVKVS